ncbi:energy transducer TonB [Gilvimarinus chinensis]|uniref:energy transducer TonB n=1 Tax=Gilvimarinus chinensis TaxID=396005 RepID=UPI00036C3DC1|nr:energy transducer TonB [Gilvimarinus chinensis]
MSTATAMRFTAIPMGLICTAALLLLMATLIQTNYTYIEPAKPVNIGNVVMPELKVEVVYDPAPTRPEEPPAPPASPAIENPVQVDAQGPNIAVFHDLSPMNDSLSINFAQPGDYLPIVKVAPQYPRTALSRGIEGEVVVSFTVTATGATRDVVVLSAQTLDGSPTSVFNRAAIRAAEGFKYKPRIENGVAQEVHGVQNRFLFELAR